MDPIMEKRTLRRTKSREMSSSSPASPNAATARPLASLRRSPLSDAAAALKRPSLPSSSSPAPVVLWPSANKPLSLADHLTNDRLIDPIPAHPKKNGSRPSAALIASPQAQSVACHRSYSEHSTRLKQGGEEEEDRKNKNRKQHHLKGGSPTIGGSMRYIGEVIRLSPSRKPGSSPSPSVLSSRYRVLRRAAKADLGLHFASADSDLSDAKIPSRKLISLPNREEQLRRPTRSSSSPISWGLSPARRSVETVARAEKGRISNSFISLGLDLLRRRWKESPSSSCSPPPHSSRSHAVSGGVKKGRAGDDEVGHQLKVMQSRLIQWRWVNARAERVDFAKAAQAEVTVSSAWVGLSNLQARVVRKRVQLEKDKLHLKLNALLSSQLNALEEWSELAQKHNSAVSRTKNCLQAVVCKLPLVDGAKVDLQLLLSALRYAKDLALASRTAISGITHMHAEKTTLSEVLVELRQLVSNERALLQECSHLLSCMFSLHIQEQSLKCHLMQLHFCKYK